MLDVIDCITTEHDLRLVVVAAEICALARPIEVDKMYAMLEEVLSRRQASLDAAA